MPDEIDQTAATVPNGGVTSPDGAGVETVPLGLAVTAPSMQSVDLPGEMIGHFRVLSMVARGGMGSVWRAHDESLDRLVALKVLPAELSEDGVLVERFLREARAQAQLSHPNVVPIYFIGEQDGRRYFAMELIVGESLADRLELGVATPWEEGLELMIAVVKGLRQAQQCGLIHRDVKPGNIMITADGVPKVADFGLAKSVIRNEPDGISNATATESQPNLTHAGAFLGTPLYVAPEQALGREVDHRADIYALGGTFFHVLAGEPVFKDASVIELIAAHENRPPDLSRLPGSVPRSLHHTFARMLAKNPEERFANYDELLEALVASQPVALVAAPWPARVATVTADGVVLVTTQIAMRSWLGIYIPWSATMALLILLSVWLRATGAQAVAGHRLVSESGAEASLAQLLARSAFVMVPAVATDLGFFSYYQGWWGSGVSLRGWMSVLLYAPWAVIPAIAIALFGAASAALQADGRALHDLITGTRVVQQRFRFPSERRVS